jgi:hypothetical protein
MATRYQSLRGMIKWAKVYEPDSFLGAENYKISFYPANEDEWTKFKATGLELQPKEDTDGVSGKYITLRRPTKKLIKDDLIVFTPPEITGEVQVSYQDENGTKVRQYNKADKLKINRVGEPIELGNGTEVVVNFSYYDTIKGKGHRLENIRVTKLVEYDRENTEASTVKEEVEVKKETKTEKKSLKEELNDEIPFGNSKDQLPW